MKQPSAEALFPKTRPQDPLYLERHSGFRYVFYIVGTGFFVVIFWFYLIERLLAGEKDTGSILIIIAGSIVAPLISLLYVFRYFRSGYAVTREAIHLKEGFFFGVEVKIPLKDIAKAARQREAREIQREKGHIRLDLKNDEIRILLDARDPKRLLKVIRTNMAA